MLHPVHTWQSDLKLDLKITNTLVFAGYFNTAWLCPTRMQYSSCHCYLRNVTHIVQQFQIKVIEKWTTYTWSAKFKAGKI